MPTATEDEKVAITGILADKTMIVKVEIGKNHTIGEAVGKLGLGVAQIISNRYNLQPPLNPFSMHSSYYPAGAELVDKLESLGSAQLTALFYPCDDQRLVIQNRIQCLAQGQPTQSSLNLASQISEMLAAMQDMNARLNKKDGIIEDLQLQTQTLRERDARREEDLQLQSQTLRERDAKREEDLQLQTQTLHERDAKREEERQQERKREREEHEEERRRERKEWEVMSKREREERERKDEQREAKWKVKYNDLKQHLLEVEETTLDTVGWLTGDDTKMLDRIKLRHLINFSQEHLAIAAELVQNCYGASLAWRVALGPSQDLPPRLARARELLGEPTIQLDEPTRQLVSSDEGMSLVVEHQSKIRDRGDKVAHPRTVSRGSYDGPISRHPITMDIPGLQVLTEFAYTRLTHD